MPIKLKRMLGRLAIQNLTVSLIVCQVMLFGLVIVRPAALEKIALVPNLVLAGEVWRPLTFLAMPPFTNPLCALFFWYLFYLMGTTLEANWGAARYNLFLLIGFLATVAASFLTPDVAATNAFLQGSVFLAFAYLFPNFEIVLFFLLPVKVRWLALLAWIGIAFTVLFYPWPLRLAALASVANFLAFFGRDIVHTMRGGQRRMAWQTSRLKKRRDQPIHRCLVCGITDKTHADMDFRYCSQCVGACGYCTAHIRDHQHQTEKSEAVKT